MPGEGIHVKNVTRNSDQRTPNLVALSTLSAGAVGQKRSPPLRGRSCGYHLEHMAFACPVALISACDASNETLR